jgi:cell growth-regulating nucleolar protein
MFRVFYPKTGFCAIAPSLVVFSFCLNEQRPTPASIISHVLYLSLSSIDSPDYESTNTHTLTQRERKREREKEMVWFQCDDCGDSIKKPALKKHFNNCSASRLSCVDCGQEFDRYSVQQHTSCVTEHEKYALGATKPGGKANYAANGGGKGGGGEKGGGGVAAEKEKGEPAPLSSPATGSEKKESIPGREFLATEAPWMCTCCNVECTGAETLKSHALGKKHKRKAKTLRAQKEEEKKNEGKPKLNPAEEKEEKKKEKKEEKKEKKARKKVIQLANKEKKKEILQEKLKAQRKTQERRVKNGRGESERRGKSERKRGEKSEAIRGESNQTGEEIGEEEGEARSQEEWKRKNKCSAFSEREGGEEKKPLGKPYS